MNINYDEHIIGAKREDLALVRRQESERGYSSPNILYTTVSSLLEDDLPMITIGKTETVKEAFNKLVTNKILSIPVYNNSAGRYTSFIDIIDIACYTLDTLSADVLSSYDTFATHPDFNITAGALADKSKRNPYVSIDTKCTVKSAIETFNKRRVYRLSVINSNGELSNILTQSFLVRWLSEKSKFLPFSSKPLSQLPFNLSNNNNNNNNNINNEEKNDENKEEKGDESKEENNNDKNEGEKKSKVITVNISKTAAHAFKVILENNISGVAIVDDDNHLVSNLSISDIKSLGFDNYMLCNLYLPLEGYLKLGKIGIRRPITVTKENTIAELLETLTTNRVHRVYIVDENGAPTDVITISDIIDVLANLDITFDTEVEDNNNNFGDQNDDQIEV